MNDISLFYLVKNWMEFSILNQEELKNEYKGIEFPQWNKGYLECLEDLRRFVYEISQDKNRKIRNE